MQLADLNLCLPGLACSLAPTLISFAVMSHGIAMPTAAGYPCPVPLQPQKPFP